MPQWVKQWTRWPFGLQPGFSGSGAVSVAPPATGDNADRIAAVLNGRTAPFSMNYPADPVPNLANEPVTVTTAAAFNTAAAVPGARIIVGASFSGNVAPSADDITVTMSNSYTISGRLTLGAGGTGASGTYINRLRWTGGNIGTIVGARFRDVLFDDLYALATSATSDFTQIEHNIGGGWDGSGNPPFERFAIINSTLAVTQPDGLATNLWGWAFHNSPSYENFDLFVGNTQFWGNGQTTRFQRITRFVMIDSVTNPGGTAGYGDPAFGNGMRIHRGCHNVWIRDSWSRGFMLMGEVNTEDPGPAVTNALFDNYDRYNPVDASWHYGSRTNNTGEYRNGLLATTSGAGDGTFSLIGAGMIDGGGNVRTGWNGTTVPDYSQIGAIR
jgi:hypothetical protein